MIAKCNRQTVLISLHSLAAGSYLCPTSCNRASLRVHVAMSSSYYEVIFEKLLCDREIQERMEIRMTEYEIHQIINITLRRICAMESGLPVEDVHYRNYLIARKVVSMVCMPN